MQISKIIYTLFFATLTTLALAGPGSKPDATCHLQGTVYDQSTGEPLTGVKISFEGREREVYTDFNGQFSLKGVRTGEHTLQLSFISYEDKQRQVKLINGENAMKFKLQSR